MRRPDISLARAHSSKVDNQLGRCVCAFVHTPRQKGRHCRRSIGRRSVVAPIWWPVKNNAPLERLAEASHLQRAREGSEPTGHAMQWIWPRPRRTTCTALVANWRMDGRADKSNYCWPFFPSKSLAWPLVTQLMEPLAPANCATTTGRHRAARWWRRQQQQRRPELNRRTPMLLTRRFS